MLYESTYYGVCDLGDSITHHGIKGQKWGIRRYQNEDGTLTELGMKRYHTDTAGKAGKSKLTRISARMYEKYDLPEPNPSKDQAWDNATTMRGKGASKLEVSAYLKANDLSPTDYFKQTSRQLISDIASETKAKIHENNKQKAIGKGDAEKIMKYAPELSTQELNEAVNRAAYMERLSNIKKNKSSFLEKFAKKGTEVANAISTAKRLKELIAPKKDRLEDKIKEAQMEAINKNVKNISQDIRDNTEGSAADKERAVKKYLEEAYSVYRNDNKDFIDRGLSKLDDAASSEIKKAARSGVDAIRTKLGAKSSGARMDSAKVSVNEDGDIKLSRPEYTFGTAGTTRIKDLTSSWTVTPDKESLLDKIRKKKK